MDVRYVRMNTIRRPTSKLPVILKRPVTFGKGLVDTSLNSSVNIPDLRIRENSILRYLKSRIESVVASDPVLFSNSGSLTIQWRETNRKSHLKDLRLIHNLNSLHFRRIPILVKNEGIILRKKTPVARVVLEFMADLQKLCRNEFMPMPYSGTFNVSENCSNDQQRESGSVIPTYSAFIGYFEKDGTDCMAGNEATAILSLNGNEWEFRSGNDTEMLWRLFYPQSESAMLQRMETFIEQHLTSTILADSVAQHFGTPLSMVIHLGRRLQRFTVEHREGAYAFFRK